MEVVILTGICDGMVIDRNGMVIGFNEMVMGLMKWL
jgi:hypothetical protein